MIAGRNPFSGEVDRHACPHADFAYQPQRTAVQLDQALGQRQAESGPFVFAGDLRVDLTEADQGLGDILRRDANSRIADSDL